MIKHTDAKINFLIHLVLLTDGIHMNSTGAKFIADETESFINIAD
jgi:hypothetical protein